jgi:catechol 2,3-dioxygenase-like lactoylglutathione lyase family enzyme
MTARPRQLIDTAAALVVSDLRHSVDFYVEKLGFSCQIDWSVNPTFAIAQHDGAAIALKLGERAGAPNRTLTPGIDMFDAYIWVRDLPALEAELKDRDAVIAEGPVERVYGCTEIAVHDPDGFRIVFGFCP